MALAIDGTAHLNASTQNVAVSLTTTQANDYIIVCVLSNGAPVLSVVSGTIGSLAPKGSGGGNAANTMEIWVGFSASPLTGDTITVHQTSAAFCTVDAFGVSGSGQTSAVFDAGGPQTSTIDPISITTANPNTLAIAAYRESSASNPTAGSGFTALPGSGADFSLVETKVLSSAQTLSCTQTVGAGSANGGVVIAIVQASAAAVPRGTLSMMGVG